MTPKQKRLDTGARRRQIVSATRRIIVRSGAQQLTIRNIASEIGITEGAIYKHFKSKRDIMLLMLEDVGYYVEKEFEKVAISRYTPLEGLEVFARGQMSRISLNRGAFFLIIAEIINERDPELHGRAEKLVRDYIKGVSRIIKDGMECGQVRASLRPVTAAATFYGMIQGLFNLWVLNQYRFNIEAEFAPLLSWFMESLRFSNHHQKKTGAQP